MDEKNKVDVGEIFTIEDESGEELEVEVMATANIDGKEYIAVSFIDDLIGDEEEDIDVYFFQVDENGDLDAVETDEEFEKVSQVFDEVFMNHDEE